MNPHGKVIARLRMAAALADEQAEQLQEHAKVARKLAFELEGDPRVEKLEEVADRATTLFRRDPSMKDRIELAIARAALAKTGDRGEIL
jgi:hypothetical protein